MAEVENTRELVVVDIGRYKKVKQALHESEERYRQLFEHIPIGIYRCAPDGLILDANHALLQMLGFPSFADLSACVGKDDSFEANYGRQEFRELLEKFGEIKGLESTWRRKDGRIIHVRENARLTRDVSGEILFYEGTVEDIGEQKAADEKFRRHMRELELLNRIIGRGNHAESPAEIAVEIIDAVVEGIGFDCAMVYHREQRRPYCRMVAARGVPHERLSDLDVLPADHAVFTSVWNAQTPVFAHECDAGGPLAAAGGGIRALAAVPLQAKDGCRYVLIVGSRQPDSFSEEEIGFLSVIGQEGGTLISKFETEQELRRSEEKFRHIAERSFDIIFILDKTGNIAYISPAVEKVAGFLPEEMCGKPLEAYLAEEERAAAREYFTTLARGGTAGEHIYRLRRRDGGFFYAEMNSTPFLTNGELQGIQVIARDISERRRHDDELLEYQERLRTLTSELTLAEERERREIAVRLHDSIGQNLVLAKMKVEALGSRQEAPPEDIAEIVRLLTETVQQTRTMIMDISPPILYDLGFRAAVEWLGEQIEKNFSIPVVVQVENLGVEPDGELRVLLFQIVRELLYNMAKHSRASCAWVTLVGKDDEISITVSDDGVGFDADAHKPGRKTSGFGYFSIHERLQVMGGSMKVKSAVGKGAAIFLQAPLKYDKKPS